jgi:hypothetical protein
MRAVTAFIVTMIVAAWAFTARAEDKALGQKHFKAGVSLLKAEEYTAAALSFEASFEAFPTKNALFNLANCYKALKRYDDALATLFRLRRDFAGKLGAELERESTALEQEIRNLVGSLVIDVDRPGATILVNGKEAGRSPLSKPLLMVPGDHKVTARLEGVEFGVETVRLLSGDEKRVTLAGREKPEDPSPRPPFPPGKGEETGGTAPPAPPGGGDGGGGEVAEGGPSGLFWAAAGGAVVTGVLSGVFFGLRGKAEGAFDDALEGWDALTPAEQSSAVGDGPWSDMKSAGEDYDKWNGAGIGMAATAGALTAAAVIILIVDLTGEEEAPAADTARATFRPSPGGLRIDF